MVQRFELEIYHCNGGIWYLMRMGDMCPMRTMQHLKKHTLNYESSTTWKLTQRESNWTRYYSASLETAVSSASYEVRSLMI